MVYYKNRNIFFFWIMKYYTFQPPATASGSSLSKWPLDRLAEPSLMICSAALSLFSLTPHSAEVLQPDTQGRDMLSPLSGLSPSYQTHILEISLSPRSMPRSRKWEMEYLYLMHGPVDRFFFLDFKLFLLAHTP